LAKQGDISSTEKLLELIRTDSDIEQDSQGEQASRSGITRLRSLFSNPISIRKAVTVGVDLGHDDLKLVKIQRITENKYEMLDYARVPFDPDMSRDSAEFHQFLQPVLADFCGRSKNIDLWCTMSSARVETRPLRIPKVSPKQIPNSVYWSYQKDAPFDEKQKVFDFEILGDIEEGGTDKTDVMAYTAPLEEVKTLKKLFANAGFPLTGISIVPYSFQTLLRTRRIDTDEKNVSSLYIGRDWSRIDIFSDGNMMLSRGIKAGIRTMIEALRKGIEGSQLELSLVKSPNDDTRRIRAVKRKLNLDFEKAQQHFFGLIHESSSSIPGTEEIAAREDSIFKMILPALERLVRQVERTLRHYALNYENARVGKIYISSGVRPHQRILDYIGEELGLPTEAINPFASGSNFLTMVPWPDSVSEQTSFAPAMGMALSNNAITPNFLHTQKDKDKAVLSQRISRGFIWAFLILFAASAFIFVRQYDQIREKQIQYDMLLSRLQSYKVRVSEDVIMGLLDNYRAKNKSVLELSQNFLDLAIISEIASATPANIRLLSISADLGTLPAKKEKGKKGKGKKDEDTNSNKTLIIDGIIQGDRLRLEWTLTEYLEELKNSPLFDQPAINRKSFEFYENREVLHFTAQLKVI
jgi:type IV pilus assembly protein PilM